MKRLYIAIENKNRELYAKVLLACVAAENGFTSIIGMNTEIKKNLAVWPEGVVLWKGLARKGGKTYKKFHDLGHLVVAWCEEGLVYPDSVFYKRYRVFREALNEVDLFFAWGQNQTDDILSEVPEGKDKVVITGNPRLDILRSEFRNLYRDEVEEIRSEYGKFILINSNFSAYTHKLGPEVAIESLKKAGRIRTDEDELFYRGRTANRKKVFEAFADMIVKLSKNLDDEVGIVLRPHTSESIKLWEDALAGAENVHIIHRGSATPWILASELLIHNDCTTGLEAYLLDKPVISYRPTAGNAYESFLPVSVSKSIEDTDELISAVSAYLNNSNKLMTENVEQKTDLLRHFIGNYLNGYSADKVVKCIEQLEAKKKSLTMLSLKNKLRKIRKKLQDVFISKTKGSSEKKEIFVRPNFPGLTVSEVEVIIMNLSGQSKRFNDMAVSLVSGTDTCIQIKKNS